MIHRKFTTSTAAAVLAASLVGVAAGTGSTGAPEPVATTAADVTASSPAPAARWVVLRANDGGATEESPGVPARASRGLALTEPTSLLLLGCGLAVAATVQRRRSAKS